MQATTASIPTASPCASASRPWSTPAAPDGGTSRISSACHRSVARPASSRSSTSSATACGAGPSSRTSPTWMRSRPLTWRVAPGLIVGVKTAHYSRTRVGACRARGRGGTSADIPVMVDFGTNIPGAPVARAGHAEAAAGRHLHAHVLGAARRTGSVGPCEPGLLQGRKRGVIFDVGHGGGSFLWRVAVPAVKEGFLPDSISTDLHIGSMNAGMKDMLNVMGKFLAMGVTLEQVVEAVDLESSARDQAGGTRPSFDRRGRRHRRAAASSAGASACRTCMALGLTRPAAGVRADAARGPGGLRSEWPRVHGMDATAERLHRRDGCRSTMT